jgi:hypothetical protein
MSLTPVGKRMQQFCSFKDALLASGLPVADLAADGTRYFAFGHRKGEPVAFVGFGCFYDEDLLHSSVEPALLRGQKHGKMGDRHHGAARSAAMHSAATYVERCIIRPGFWNVQRKDVPAALATSWQFLAAYPDPAVSMCLSLV